MKRSGWTDRLIITVPLALVGLLWVLLLVSYLRDGGSSLPLLESSGGDKSEAALQPHGSFLSNARPAVAGVGGVQEDNLVLPKRFTRSEQHVEPPPLDEYRNNLTTYLHTLHANLAALASPHVDPIDVWILICKRQNLC